MRSPDLASNVREIRAPWEILSIFSFYNTKFSSQFSFFTSFFVSYTKMPKMNLFVYELPIITHPISLIQVAFVIIYLLN